MVATTNKKYDVVYADPPWSYRQQGSKGVQRGMAAQHYPTMKVEDICALPVRSICSDKALLFMWATFPNMAEALQVMQAWGFTYKTAAFVWVKLNKKSSTPFWGMGAYTRANAEVCLLGVSKGTRASAAVKAHNIHQVVLSPVLRHSEKPAEVRARIEQLTGKVQSIELFARTVVPGWDCWGNEVPSSVTL